MFNDTDKDLAKTMQFIGYIAECGLNKTQLMVLAAGIAASNDISIDDFKRMVDVTHETAKEIGI